MAETKWGYILGGTSAERPVTVGGREFKIMEMASLRVYGGKLMCGTPAACKKSGRGVALRIKTIERLGICLTSSQQSLNYITK